MHFPRESAARPPPWRGSSQAHCSKLSSGTSQNLRSSGDIVGREPLLSLPERALSRSPPGGALRLYSIAWPGGRHQAGNSATARRGRASTDYGPGSADPGEIHRGCLQCGTGRDAPDNRSRAEQAQHPTAARGEFGEHAAYVAAASSLRNVGEMPPAGSTSAALHSASKVRRLASSRISRRLAAAAARS